MFNTLRQTDWQHAERTPRVVLSHGVADTLVTIIIIIILPAIISG